MSKDILNNIWNYILNNDGFIITSHIRSDGDSIGSEMALAEVLRSRGKRFYIYNRDECARYLGFLPGIDLVHTTPPPDLHLYRNVIVTDSAFSPRIGDNVYRDLCNVSNENIIVFDHHPNEAFNDKCYIKPEASSTGELVFDFLEHINYPLNPNLAMCLFTAIFTDTFGFRQTNANARAFYIVSRIFDLLPGSYYDIIVKLYESRRYQGLKLLGSLLETAYLDEKSGIIHGYLTRDMFRRWSAIDEDIEDFINHLRSVENVRVACIFRETDEGEIKVNLRSKDEDLNLVPFVKKYRGGGHPMAAGFSLPPGDLQESIARILDDLKQYMILE